MPATVALMDDNTADTALTQHLAEQLEWHWSTQLRPRFDGLTDDEYFWEPVAGCWNVHHRDAGSPLAAGGSGDWVIDFVSPEPTPAPVTTIAWRLGHVIVGVLAERNHSHFGGPAGDYRGFVYAGSADEALAQLDEHYARWMAGVKSLSSADLRTPVGPAEGNFARAPMLDLVLHIHREVIHHGAEIALLRDLYAHRPLSGSRTR